MTQDGRAEPFCVAVAAKTTWPDEVAQAFRDDVARDSDMMSPGVGAALADFWHSVAL